MLFDEQTKDIISYLCLDAKDFELEEIKMWPKDLL